VSDEEERDRDALAGLTARLKRARETSRVVPRPQTRAGPTSGLGLALRVGVDMVAGVVVGAGMGYLLDRWLGTSPWRLVVFFFLGAAGGGLNAYRTVTRGGFGQGPPERGDRRGDERGEGRDGS
jgi:ATP synthase protein I